MIASKIGELITTDKFMAKQTHPSYVRALVEVDTSLPLVLSVLYRAPNGKMKEQVVLYKYEPSFCSKCQNISHETGKCDEAKQNTKKMMGRSQLRRRKTSGMVLVQDEEMKAATMNKVPATVKVQAIPVETLEEASKKIHCVEIILEKKEINTEMANETQEASNFGSKNEVIESEDEVMDEPLSTIPSNEDCIPISKWFTTESHTKKMKRVRSGKDDLEAFFSGMATEEEEGNG